MFFNISNKNVDLRSTKGQCLLNTKVFLCQIRTAEKLDLCKGYIGIHKEKLG